MPGKRKRGHQEEEDDDFTLSSASEFESIPRRSVARTRKTKPGSKRRTNNAGTEKVSVGGSDGISGVHSRSDHVLFVVEPIQDALLQWYSTVRDSRGMPWRKVYDPNLSAEARSQRAYEVWISEIMLQQTQVATVIPYYNSWMERFPTLSHLAESSIEDVNGLWKGLGYYSRASRLLAGAQKAVKENGGRLPDNAKDMEASIPGIGRYSAGAICSIAYGERVPVLDGNVHRLLSRMLALHAPPKTKPTLDILWSAAAAMVRGSSGIYIFDRMPWTRPLFPATDDDLNGKHPGDINQALIELGSTVCKVRDPSCDICPLRPWCLAQLRKAENFQAVVDIEDACTLCDPVDDSSDVTIYPMKVERKKSREETDVVSVIEWCPPDTGAQPQILLVRRPEKGLLAGLYEFPTIPNVSSALSSQSITDLGIDQMASIFKEPVGLNGGVQPDPDLETRYTLLDVHFAGDVQHVFSHIKKTYKVQRIRVRGGNAPPSVRPQNDTVGPSGRKRKGSKPETGSAFSSMEAIWTPMGEVVKANIGTGVVKMWRLVTALGGYSDQ
ncbi:hypothetical protein AAF712_002781 [Marasmius tenuissimus]|uniref:Adenine DNA glycosylase n=1 Tax=Marasmius tenuissimus TaxID=585030 RepID=A0ABR3AA91_9AGAR